MKFVKGIMKNTYYPEIKIAPSILSADYARLGEEIKDVAKRGVDLIHIDIMDGHFVPNITLGPDVVKSIRKVTKLPLDVHLMIENPGAYIPRFVDAGADIVTFHIEIFIKDKKLDLKKLEKIYSQAEKIKNVRMGLTLNPSTPIGYFQEILKVINVNFVLIMSVNPGFGGQSFIPRVLNKARFLRHDLKFKGDIEIDGGINERTYSLALEAGCNILVAGSYIFKARDRSRAIQLLRKK